MDSSLLNRVSVGWRYEQNQPESKYHARLGTRRRVTTAAMGTLLQPLLFDRRIGEGVEIVESVAPETPVLCAAGSFTAGVTLAQRLFTDAEVPGSTGLICAPAISSSTLQARNSRLQGLDFCMKVGHLSPPQGRPALADDARRSQSGVH
jgi:hypothetical protein